MIHLKQGLLLERNFCSDVTCDFGQLLIPENLRVTCEVRIQLSVQTEVTISNKFLDGTEKQVYYYPVSSSQ